MDCKASNAPGKRSTKPHYRVGPVNYAFDIPAEVQIQVLYVPFSRELVTK